MSRSRLPLLLSLSLALAACDDGTAPGDGDDDGGAAADAAPGAPDASAPGRPDAAPQPPADPAATGPFAVDEEEATAALASGGSASVTLFVPDGAGPFPLVIVSPGFQLSRTQYASTARHLASHGFVVVAQDFGGGFGADHMAYAGQTLALVDWAIAGGGGALAGQVDGARVGLAGHSMGGKVSLLAASLDSRIGAVVGWDPVDANSPSVTPERMNLIDAPLTLIGETTNASGGFMPCAPAADNYQQYFQAASSPALEVTVVGADHMDWVDDTGCLVCGFCTAGSVDDAEVKALTRRTTTAAFRRWLGGETAMDNWLTGQVMQADVQSGKVALQSK